jgi:hypothetical protein
VPRIALPLVPAFHAQAIHRDIAGSCLHIYLEGRHNIHIKYADDFNAAVLGFLTDSF